MELPESPRGVTDITYFINEEERTIRQKKMNELPQEEHTMFLK